MMLRTQETLDGEIIVDSFAGGGGASTGIELALGRIVNAAINHDPAAIRMHEANHPYTEHYQASVWDVDPEAVCRGRPVALAWFSPDCKHFSKAKGAALVDRKIRGLAWIVLRWAAKVRPRIKLQPFRTFLEVAQPESEFLLRVDSEKGIAFFEADGGIWRLEAKRNIAEYFERGLKDLIEQGKVVIMQ